MRFEALPRPARAVIVGAYGYRNAFLRYRAEYRRYSRFLAETDGADQAEREAYQLAELIALLSDVSEGTPALRRVAVDAKSFRSDANPYALLKQLPFQEKAAMRAMPQDFANANVKAIMTSSTSGSTGSPMTFGHDAVGLQRRIALMKDHYRLAGVGARAKSIRLSGRILSNPDKHDAKPWLYNPSENQVFLSTYHLNDRHSGAIIDMVRRFKPEVLDGYPSAILEFLSLSKDGQPLVNSVRSVITTAETLDDELRSKIEHLSATTVLDYYAASEGVHPIQQCPHGMYHVRWQGGIFEIYNDQGLASEGDGELVCTSFVQRKTPLIRYRTGDLVSGYSRKGKTCACGLCTPTVDAILGRVEDYVRTPDGRRIGMFPYRTLKLLSGIEASQIKQLGFSDFEVLAVLNPAADADSVTAEVKKSFERALGYPIRVRLEVVNQIAKGPNGKVRSVISRF